MSARPHLAAALAGFGGVLLNVVAVAALGPVPHAYAPGDVAAWHAELLANPGHAVVSAWTFTVGLVLLAAFAAGLAFAERSGWVVVGAAVFGAGALLDAAGTFAPIALLHVGPDAGQALLWLSLLLDSGFNGLLGLGLLCFSVGLSGWPKGVRGLAAVAGLASLPVALQFSSDTFARLLAIAGPLWLVWVCWASLRLARVKS